MQKLLILALAATADCFKLAGAGAKLQQQISKVVAPATALAISVHAEAAHAKSVLGVNGGLDFGPLAGDQPGGEGTGKVRAPTRDKSGQAARTRPPHCIRLRHCLVASSIIAALPPD